VRNEKGKEMFDSPYNGIDGWDASTRLAGKRCSKAAETNEWGLLSVNGSRVVFALLGVGLGGGGEIWD